MIIVKVNNEEVESQAANLAELLKQLDISKDSIAVAVNKYVIRKNNWESYKLKHRDNITIITPTQGG